MSGHVSEWEALSVPAGWQTRDKATGETFGPAFNRVQDLWAWQEGERVRHAAIAKAEGAPQ